MNTQKEEAHSTKMGVASHPLVSHPSSFSIFLSFQYFN
jgi:hypothetical protein